MKIIDCEQYSEEWWSTRLGKPTGSMIGGIVGPSGSRSDKWDRHLFRLAGERITGKRDEGYVSEAMKRGHLLEPHARDMFELYSGRTVTQVGIVLRDDEQVGISPDGLLLDDINDPAGLEIKCPSAGVHTEYLYKNEVPPIYRPQVFLGLYLTGYRSWYFYSYNPDFTKSLMCQVTKNDPAYRAYASALDLHLQDFLDELDFVTTTLKHAA